MALAFFDTFFVGLVESDFLFSTLATDGLDIEVTVFTFMAFLCHGKLINMKA